MQWLQQKESGRFTHSKRPQEKMEKNMVRAAKKEPLESSTHSESGEHSFAPRKFSPVSQRILEILRITWSRHQESSRA